MQEVIPLPIPPRDLALERRPLGMTLAYLISQVSPATETLPASSDYPWKLRQLVKGVESAPILVLWGPARSGPVNLIQTCGRQGRDMPTFEKCFPSGWSLALQMPEHPYAAEFPSVLTQAPRIRFHFRHSHGPWA